MITNAKYEKLKKNFGKTSSWAIWDEPKNGNWYGKSNVDSLECFVNEKKLIKSLKTQYIFVGYTPSKQETKNRRKNWGNFHSTDARKSQDYKLRYALVDTDYWGSFMTDLYPNIIETNSCKAETKITKRETEKAIKRLLEIINIIGGDPIIVAMGGKTYRALIRNLPDSTRLLQIKHYACFINQDCYRKDVLKKLK